MVSSSVVHFASDLCIFLNFVNCNQELSQVLEPEVTGCNPFNLVFLHIALKQSFLSCTYIYSQSQIVASVIFSS